MALGGLGLELLLGSWSSRLVEWHRLSLELLVNHMWWELVVLALVAHWHWLQVLVWVEATEAAGEGSQLGQIRDLDHGGLLPVELGVWWRVGLEVVASVVVPTSALVVVVLHLLWHWRKSDALWEIWEWVDQLSPLFLGMVEGASLAELALSLVEEVLAWLRLVVGVDGSESSLAEVLWEWLKNSKILNLVILTSFGCLNSVGPWANWQNCWSGHLPDSRKCLHI